MLADKFILDLDKVKLHNKYLLPSHPGIYYAVDNKRNIWYIGRLINLQKRWNSENSHHRYHQLLSISDQENLGFFIYYSNQNKRRLVNLEKIQIAKYQPCLNYTPVMKKGFITGSMTSKRVYHEHADNIINASLKILSILDSHKHVRINKRVNNMEASTDNIEISNEGLKRFERKFISLNNEAVGLDFELEICADREQRLFVRHYAYFAFIYGRIDATDLSNKDKLESCLSTLESRCKILYNNSLRWLRYKLKRETILLIDEEDCF